MHYIISRKSEYRLHVIETMTKDENSTCYRLPIGICDITGLRVVIGFPKWKQFFIYWNLILRSHILFQLAAQSNDRPSSILPRIVQTCQLKSVLEQAHRTGVVDLSFLALGDRDCGQLCDHLLSSDQSRAITELNLSGNALKTIVTSNTESVSGILAVLVQMAPHLISLQLATNLINMNEILRTLNVLSRHLHPSADGEPSV